MAADYRTLRSPETYLGYGQATGFASPDGCARTGPHDYAAPPTLGLNDWAPSATWTITERAAVLAEPGGRLAFRFQARDVNLVMGPALGGDAIPFRVRLDGRPADGAHGSDIDADGNGTVTEQRTYQLIRQPDPIENAPSRSSSSTPVRGLLLHVRLSADRRGTFGRDPGSHSVPAQERTGGS